MKKRALISGNTRGIGKAITDTLIQNGYDVVGIARNKAQDGNTRSIDLANISALPKHIQSLAKKPFDVIVHNAGCGLFGPLENLSFSDIQHILNLNLHAHILITKILLPSMKRQKKGDIIFIGSESAKTAKKLGTLYCASKFGLRGFALALRDECARFGIRVSLIHPGAVKTDFFQEQHFQPGENPGEHLKAEDVAKAVLLILNARKGTVFEEIFIQPQKPRFIIS